MYERSQDDQATFEHFAGVKVDDEVLSATAYDAKSGSVVLSLKSSYLQGLSAGTHTLEPQFDDGTAQKASFTIADAKDGNKTNGPDEPDSTARQNAGTTKAAGVTTNRVTLPNTSDPSFCALPLALLGAVVIILRRATS